MFFIYKAIQMESVAKSYIRKGFIIYEEMLKYLTIYEEMLKYLTIYEEAVSHATDPFWFPYIWENFIFFISVQVVEMG